jgi:hypothetical protein
MSAPRGGASGRARGRGRGGSTAARGGSQGPPITAQLRQLNRLQEPEEMPLLRHFRDLGATQIHSVYGQSGLLDRQVQLPPEAFASAGVRVPEGPTLVSVLMAENLLAQRAERKKREIALGRRSARLGAERAETPWDDLSQEERRVLLLSQKEFNSFRTTGGNPVEEESSSEEEEEEPSSSTANKAGGGPSPRKGSPKGSPGPTKA